MKQLNYLFLLFMIPIGSFAQQITVNPLPEPTDGYSVEYLVNEVLIEGDCAQVDNITSPMNASFDGQAFESFGYFESNGADFPFEDGIILASTDVSSIPNGPIGGGFGGWTGDPDLAALSGEDSNNATIFEFDFVPFVNEISFNYLMASQEYDDFFDFPCTFEDTFAFIISGPYDVDGNLIVDDFPAGTPGVFQDVNPYNTDANPNTPDVNVDMGGLNIATLPGTNIPATVTNIHNFTTCDPGDPGEFAAAQFYDAANSGNGSTAFNGQTIPLVASTEVIAGQIYKIKLTISDSRDTAFNSAVFIEGESFSLGDIDLGDPITLQDPDAECTGTVISLDTGLPANTEIVFEWYFNEDPNANPTELLVGEEGPSLEATTTGSYAVFAFIPGPNGAPLGCFNTGITSLEFFDTPEGNLEDTLICPDGEVELNATPTNLDDLLTQDASGPTYTWFLDGSEIDGENGPILTATQPGNYEVEINFNTCLVNLSSSVVLVDYDMTLGEDVSSCVAVSDSPSFEIVPEFTNLTDAEIASVDYLWSTGETSPTITVSSSDVYTLTTTYEGCEVTAEVTVDFIPTPDVTLEDVAICDDTSVTLNAEINNINEINAIDPDGITYTWFQNGTEISGENESSLVVNEADFYSVEVDFLGCDATAEAEVSIVNYMLDLGDAPLPCIQEGQSPEFTIVPDLVGVDDADLGQVDYVWSTGETTPTITVTTSGVYSLSTTFNGCTETDEVEVIFTEAQDVFVPDYVVCFDEASLEIQSNYTFNTADEIIWEDPNGIITQDQANLNLDWSLTSGVGTAENEIVGEYSLTVIIGGCEVSTTFNVDFRRQSEAGSTMNSGNIMISCSLPEGISPNADGINDCFDLSFLAMEPGISSLQIFNRYGRKIYEADSSYTNQFCGQDEGGNNLVTGTYFYVLKLNEAGQGFEQVERGWIYINREEQ